MNLPLIIALLAVGVAGCNPNVRPDPVEQVPARAPLSIPDPEPLKPNTPTWIVITPGNAEAVWKKLQANGSEPVLFGLTDGDYEQLSVDFAETRNFIVKQRRITQEYRDYYEPKTPAPNK